MKAVAKVKPTFLEQLHSIKIGGDRNDPKQLKISRRDLQYILKNLAMLVENGLSLPKALATIGREKAVRKHRPMLENIHRQVEAGASFSSALSSFPKVFTPLMLHQVQVGERTGTIPETMRRLTSQLEKQGELKSKLVKRLSYPALVVTAGTGLVVFMLTVVVPQFEGVYGESGAALPFITRSVTYVSESIVSYGWIVLPVITILGLAIYYIRRNDDLALRMDGVLLRVPVLGPWLRDIAIHQFLDALCIMLNSGFVPADALAASAGAVGNRAVKKAVVELRGAIVRGERLSTELDRRNDIFPPTMSQLIIVGEQIGSIPTAAKGVKDFVEEQIDSRMAVALGAIEPVLTISMAAVIGCIVLAIYMPMFGMFDAMDF